MALVAGLWFCGLGVPRFYGLFSIDDGRLLGFMSGGGGGELFCWVVVASCYGFLCLVVLCYFNEYFMLF